DERSHASTGQVKPLGSTRRFGARAGGARHSQEIEPGAQANHGERMNLGNARFANAECRSHLLHGEFFIIVEGENALFLFRQFGNGFGQKMFHLRAQALEVGCLFRLRGDAVGEVFVFAVARILDAQAAEFEAVEFGEQGLQLVKVNPHLLRDFIFGGGAAELAGEIAVRRINEAAFAAQFARAPVQFAETVEDGAADTELGVRTELHLLGQIELVEGVDQSDDAGMNQVFEGHVAGQALVYAAGNVTNLGKL